MALKIAREDIQGFVEFIEERIEESFLPHEKIALKEGLELIGVRLDELLLLTIRSFGQEQVLADQPPELNMLLLPKSAIFKKVQKKLSKPTKKQEAVLTAFGDVQLRLAYLIFEYFRTAGNEHLAHEYFMYVKRQLQRMEARLGDPPDYIKNFLRSIDNELTALRKRLGIANTFEMSDEVKGALQQLFAPMKGSAFTPEKSVFRIHFEDRGGTEFERLAFAYVTRYKEWDKTPEWIGQVGSDQGRDIWAICNGDSFCYLCANFKALIWRKAKKDIDRLVEARVPVNCIVVCGGTISSSLREKIKKYGRSKGIKEVEVWSGVEFEEMLRKETPSLIKRFSEGTRINP